MNLEDTIAVSHNYCSPTNFNSVWREARNKRPGMAFHWLKKLQQNFPGLSDIAKKVSGPESDDGKCLATGFPVGGCRGFDSYVHERQS